jgi:nitrate/nitrite transporter NarK
MTRAVAAKHVSLYFAAFAARMRAFVGTLSDRIGRRKPVLIVE